jgi:hypothetical protein
MRHFKTRAWISESDYELVRVEIKPSTICRSDWDCWLACKGTVAAFSAAK